MMTEPAVSEILVPRTDGGAGVQVAIVLVAMVVVAVLVRRERALVTLTVGVGSVLLGLLGMRALH